MEMPRASNGGRASSLLDERRTLSFCPSGRTPTRPVSLAARVTTPSLPLRAGFFSTPSIRTHVTPASIGWAGAEASSRGSRAVMPIHSVDCTCEHRGAACTALIHSSRLANHIGDPCSQPMAEPGSTLTRRRLEPVSTWKPDSMDVTREFRSTGKSFRCVDIAHAASKTPPGGAVGTSTRLVTTSKVFFLGCFLAFSASR